MDSMVLHCICLVSIGIKTLLGYMGHQNIIVSNQICKVHSLSAFMEDKESRQMIVKQNVPCVYAMRVHMAQLIFSAENVVHTFFVRMVVVEGFFGGRY